MRMECANPSSMYSLIPLLFAIGNADISGMISMHVCIQQQWGEKQVLKPQVCSYAALKDRMAVLKQPINIMLAVSGREPLVLDGTLASSLLAAV